MPGDDGKITILRVVYEELLTKGKVRNQNDFSDKIEFNAVATSMMLKGTKAINLRVLENLHEKFQVDTNIFFEAHADGHIYQIELEEEELKKCKQENEKLKAQVDALIKAIEKLNG